jgi:hypothetical protein
MKAKITIALLTAAALAGCATEAQRKDAETNAWKQTLPLPNADYGSYPENYEELVKAYLARSLKDPESARYSNFSQPRKEHIITSVSAKEATYGYSVCVSVNAKNSYGGYTGNHVFWFFIRDGKVLRSQDTQSKPFGSIVYQGRLVNCQ